MEKIKISLGKTQRQKNAFTLIELLVVIAIIGILAALITNLAGPAATKRKIARVQAELAQIETAIEAYQAKKNFYPPDNGKMKTDGPARLSSATNQLFYELTGTIYQTNQFQTINGSETISVTVIQNIFNVDGFANSSVQSSEVKNFFAGLKSTQYRELSTTPDVQLLIVPVDGPNDLNNSSSGKKLNPWHYDSSSTNRHNPESYDLWAEILIGGKTNIIGNWKE